MELRNGRKNNLLIPLIRCPQDSIFEIDFLKIQLLQILSITNVVGTLLSINVIPTDDKLVQTFPRILQ